MVGRSRWWRWCAPGAVTLAALTLGGGLTACGGHHQVRRRPRHTATPTATPTATQSSGGTVSGLRTFRFSPDGQEQLAVTVYDLRRTGPFVTLDFKAACAAGCTSGFGFAFNFYEGEGTFGATSLAGIRLLDPIGNKVYRVIQDAGQNQWQSELDIGLSSPPAELLWARFPAPPPAVGKLDVMFSNGGPQLTGVPVTSPAHGPSPSQVGAGVERPPQGQFAKPPDSTDPSGLTLPVNSLVLTVGNASGSDAESARSAIVTLDADVLFAFGKSTLTARARTILAATAAKVAQRATGAVTVDGYTDSKGPDSVNVPLSQARARAVVKALKPLVAGAAVSFRASGHGAEDPVAPNTRPDGSDNPAGRRLNRRVTITYKVKQAAPPVPPPATTTAPPAPSGGSGTVTYHAASGSDYTVRVDRLYRDGDLLVADFSAQCLASYNNACNAKSDFAAVGPPEGSVDVPPVAAGKGSITGFSSPYASANAVYMESPGGSIYDPANDDAGLTSSPLVANTDPLTSAQGPKPFEPLWAYFPAPPANISTMTFVLPGGKARIAGVPIQPAP